MPRYPANVLGAVALRSTISDEFLVSASRHYRDFSLPGLIHDVVSLSGALVEWCDVFVNEGVSMLAASSVSRRTISRVLHEIDAEYTRLTHPLVVPDAAGTDPLAVRPLPERHLNEILDLFAHLPEFVAGVESPAGSDGEETAWDPSDGTLNELVESTLPALGRIPKSRAPHDEEQLRRLVALARRAAEELVAHFERSGRGGMSLIEVGAAVANAGPQAVEAHRRFLECIDRLRAPVLIVERLHELSLQPLAGELLDAWSAWRDQCLAKVPMKRSTRQSKRKNLGRCVGRVAKYGHLARGADNRTVFRHAIHCIRTVAVRVITLAEKVAALSPPAGSARAPARSWEGLSNKLTHLVSDPASIAMWNDSLQLDAHRCSQLIGNIVADCGQEEPWLVGAKVPQLSGARILQAPSDAEQVREFIELLHRMQRAGLAAQLRWEYFDGSSDSLPRIADHQVDALGSKWLVNPLGMAMAD